MQYLKFLSFSLMVHVTLLSVFYLTSFEKTHRNRSEQVFRVTLAPQPALKDEANSLRKITSIEKSLSMEKHQRVLTQVLRRRIATRVHDSLLSHSMIPSHKKSIKVEFRLGANNGIERVKLMTSSGDSSLDRCVLSSLKTISLPSVFNKKWTGARQIRLAIVLV